MPPINNRSPRPLSEEVELQDEMRWQSFNFQRTIRTLAVRLVIVEVFRGTVYDETPISEVRFH